MKSSLLYLKKSGYEELAWYQGKLYKVKCIHDDRNGK
jgi:hypothetical protein